MNEISHIGPIGPISRYQLWPFVRLEDGTYSIPDEMLHSIYGQIIEDGRDGIVFYGGAIKDFEDFLKYLKESFNHFVFAVDSEKKEFVFMAWLNNIQKTSAFCHFCGLGKNTYRPEIGKMILDYWKSTGVPIVLIGIIPEINSTAIKLTEQLGFINLGTIPHLCFIASTGEIVGGKVLYFNFWEVKDG